MINGRKHVDIQIVTTKKKKKKIVRETSRHTDNEAKNKIKNATDSKFFRTQIDKREIKTDGYLLRKEKI